MVTVNNNKITLVCGDTVEVPVTIRLRSGEEYVPTEGDVIRFAVKESYGANMPVIIYKKLDNEHPIIRIESCETGLLTPRRKPYVYDIEITMVNGYVDTVLRGEIVVLEEVC